MREPGTTCRLRISYWDGERPVAGDFLRTPSGTCYRIDRALPSVFEVTRLGKDAVQFGEPGVFTWVFDKR